jgi:rhamnosyltransferase
MSQNITAIIVSYQPNILTLANLASTLSLQCKKVIIIDNTVPACLPLVALSKRYLNIQTISLGENLGVGAAQNIGLRQALNTGCEGIVLFDQDSTVDSAYIHDIWHSYLIAATITKGRIAAVGPNYTDSKHTASSPFVKIIGFKVSRVICKSDDTFVNVDCLIASGCLLIPTFLQDIGLMREDLFIDYVDTEWCLRAKKKGYLCIGSCTVKMQHSIGDDSALLLGRRFTIHSPLRHYYLMRNAIALYLYTNLSLQWKIADAMRLICKFGVYALIGKPCQAHLAMMIKGLWHGTIKRMGKL